MNILEQIGLGSLVLGIVIVAGLYLRSTLAAREKARLERKALDEAWAREVQEEQTRLGAERNSAIALFALTLPTVYRNEAMPNYSKTIDSANRLRASFEGLTTFQEVNIWDSEAKKAAEDIATLGRALLDRRIEFVEMIASYKATTTDSENLKSARLEKSFAVINILDREIKALPVIHDHLMACAERTPGSKKEQALLLRELRTEKKELQAEKKAIKTGATQIKRDARQQASEAGYVDGIFGQYYASKIATWERRAIRRAKEAALGPHEDAMMAVDRQIDTVEKKITWLRRFGEGVVDPDDID